MSGENRIGEGTRIHPSAILGSGLEIGDRVRIGPHAIVNDNVRIGGGSTIGPGVILGEHSKEWYARDEGHVNAPCVLGENSVVRSGTVLYAGSSFGPNLATGHYAVVREACRFGRNCSLGTYFYTDDHATVGNYSRFNYGVGLCRNSRVNDYVWIFNFSVLLEDPCPPCGECIDPAAGPVVLVDDYAVLATNVTVLPGVKIGKDALIGAGALVTKDVPDGMIAVGSPARVVKRVEEFVCERGKYRNPYPWRKHFSRGMPWAKGE